MRLGRFKSCGNGVLQIGRDLVTDAERLARGAGLAFADHGKGSGNGRRNLLDQRLEAHCIGQLPFECRYIDDPRQRIDLLLRGAELHFAPVVAMNDHSAHGRDVVRLGPAPYRLQQRAGSGVERIRPDVLPGLFG